MENVLYVIHMFAHTFWYTYVTNVITVLLRFLKISNYFNLNFFNYNLFISIKGRCAICGAPGISDAFYCRECTLQEKDRDGCPKIINLGSARSDLFYERKKYGFKKR